MSRRRPHGVQVLVRKASVDPEFKKLLLERRADAADEIGLMLDPAEKQILAAVPSGQLERIISHTTVPDEHRPVFLGKSAAAMLGTLGLATTSESSLGCRPDAPYPTATGIAPDRLDEEPEEPEEKAKKAEKPDEPRRVCDVLGTRPDRVGGTKETRPDSRSRGEG